MHRFAKTRIKSNSTVQRVVSEVKSAKNPYFECGSEYWHLDTSSTDCKLKHFAVLIFPSGHLDKRRCLQLYRQWWKDFTLCNNLVHVAVKSLCCYWFRISRSGAMELGHSISLLFRFSAPLSWTFLY